MASFRVVQVCVVVFGVIAGTGASPQQVRTIVLTKAAFGATISHSELVVNAQAQFKLVQFHRVDTATSSDSAFRHVEEHVYGQSERQDGVSRYQGHSIWVLPGADRVFLRWSGATIPTQTMTPETVVDSGTIVVTGGAGRYARVQGRGSYQGFASGPLAERVTITLRF